MLGLLQQRLLHTSRLSCSAEAAHDTSSADPLLDEVQTIFGELPAAVEVSVTSQADRDDPCLAACRRTLTCPT